jgi:signal transduction histidine kinase
MSRTLSTKTYLALILGLLFLILSVVVVVLVNSTMKRLAITDAEQSSRMLLDHNLAIHTYFSQDLKPNLFEQLGPTTSKDYFEPVWMSSTYAIRKIDGYFHHFNPSPYYYKECAINARSPENEADNYEKAFLVDLQNSPRLTTKSAIRVLDGKPYFTLLRRGEAMEESCLRCHSTPEQAPGDLVRHYGPERSFHRKVQDVAQAISIRIPVSEAFSTARNLSFYLSGLLLVALGGGFLFVWVGNKRLLIDPMAKIQEQALQIASEPKHLGETIPEPKLRELDDLVVAFNQMSVALRKTYDELEQRVLERTKDLTDANQTLEKEIEDRLKAEEDREAIRTQLLQAQKMEAIGTLTKGIAHDFNNLLTIMNGYTEMILIDKTEDDPIYADLQKILQTGLKGADMVQRLLSFTKQTATKLEPVDLNHRIDETKKLMDRIFPKTIEIETNLPDDLGIVNADAGQMDQLLMNLCVNARDAMPDGGQLRIETRNITVDEDYCRLHVGAKPGRHVLIEISDTGTGMSKEIMDRMFDPFFTTKGWDFKKGTGLGLSVAKGIVEQHGGWITCQSELGQGTTFTLYFPIIEDLPEAQKPEPTAETVPGSEKILLVDDEEYVRDLGKRILEREGYKVITAANGKEALEIYSREQSNIALVVLDLIMPQMEGKQCLEELLKINPQVKVIVSTGHSLDARESLLLGTLARGFVNKPYEVGQMVQTVKGVLKAGGPAE